MAQVLGGSTYDHSWHADKEVMRAYLRRASDAYAAKKLTNLPRAKVVGAILHPLVLFRISDLPPAQWPELNLTPANILSRLRRDAPP
jgi:hypothetical protein